MHLNKLRTMFLNSMYHVCVVETTYTCSLLYLVTDKSTSIDCNITKYTFEVVFLILYLSVQGEDVNEFIFQTI